MVKSVTGFIHKITSIKAVILLALAVIALEAGFSAFLPDFTKATGGPLLDMSVWYSADYAYERLSAVDAAADSYFRIRVIDFFFPAAYALTLSVLSCLIYRKKYTEEENYRWVLMAPFFAAAFDYIENILLVVLYRLLPAQYSSAAVVLNFVTLIKFGLLSLSILLVITGAVSLLKGGDSMLIRGNRFKGGKKD